MVAVVFGWLVALPRTGLTLISRISQVFPLYLRFFGGGFAVYQAFGTFLVLTFWLYLLGLVQTGGKEPGANREPSTIKHPDLTGMSDGHAETSQSRAE